MHLVGNLGGVRRYAFERRLLCVQGTFVPTFRNGVIAKLARKRVAAKQALQPQPNSARYSEVFDRFVRILRACRLKPAVPRKQEGQIRFVEPKRKKRDLNGLTWWDRLQSVLFSLKRLF